MPIVLKVRHLTIRLKIDGKAVPAVEDLSFDLERGRTLALVGESGCGKSMTALSILRILPTPPALAPEGEILYGERNLFSLSEQEMQKIRGRKLAMIFQDPMSALNPVYSIGDQLLEVVHTHLGLEGEAARQKVIASFEDVRLPNPVECMRQYPHQLSGGMLQRAMIAMAIICEPDVLIADEPTTALDVTTQAQILHLLKELQEKKGMATLLITHDMGVVAEMADRVLVMYAGEYVEEASAENLFDSPAHPYTQALFASRPGLAQSRGKLPAISGHVPRLTEMPAGCRFHPRCPDAMALCKSAQKVPSFSLAEPAHQTACWLYDKDLKWKIESQLPLSEGENA